MALSNKIKIEVEPEQPEEPYREDFVLHGGDIVRIKHAESGGFITVDDSKINDSGMVEAFVRIYNGMDPNEEFTTNQMFEIEKSQDNMERSGTPLEWEEDAISGE